MEISQCGKGRGEKVAIAGLIAILDKTVKSREPLETPADYPRSSAPFHRGRDCELRWELN